MNKSQKDKIIEFALRFLKANLEDSEAGAMLAASIGLIENEEDFDDARDGKKLIKLIESVQKA